MKNLFFAALLFIQVPLYAQTKAANLAKAKEAWNNFKTAYAKNEKDSLKLLMEIPVRENPEDTALELQRNFDRKAAWRLKPVQMDLPAFLTAIKNLKKYNLKVSPRLSDPIEITGPWLKGYKFDARDKIYVVDLERETKNNKNLVTGYGMALYFKIHKGTCQLFAFNPETYFQNTGD